MNSRLELQELLERTLGSRNVYFQPPPTIRMQYPAIVYSRAPIENRYANNNAYLQNRAYQLVVIDKNPDSAVVQKVALLPYCKHVRNYKSDNLNHDVFTIYFKGDLE